jgi:predicted metal-dependent phosphotriesterase family hydrolase
VALDKACLDLVFNHQSTSGDNASALIERINSRHGTHTVEYAEQIGLGSQKYRLLDIDEQTSINGVTTKGTDRYNVYTVDGKKVLTNASSLKSLKKGTYIINGRKQNYK